MRRAVGRVLRWFIRAADEADAECERQHREGIFPHFDINIPMPADTRPPPPSPRVLNEAGEKPSGSMIYTQIG